MDNLIIKKEDGTVVFTGREDPKNPPVVPVGEGSKSECPVCHAMVDYLVGENTPDGGVQGCETCWKPSTGKRTAELPTKDLLDQV